MQIQQADLFHGMERDFVKQVMDVTTKETHEGGEILFNEGEVANYFYVLLKGHVKLSVRESGQVYVVNRAGEAFGWSSLVGRDNYSASAECIGPTSLIKMEKDALEKILQREPANGLIFFRRLARSLGHRLIQSYKGTPTSADAEASLSYGTGQVVETASSMG